MKKIYWCLQQLENIGGTEIVTMQIIDFLKSKYEIHLILFTKINLNKITYKIPQGVILEDISFPDKISQFDLNFYSLINEKKYFKAIKFLFKTINYYLFKRFKIRKKINSLVNKEDLIVVGSSELLLFIPKNKFTLQHFHFNKKLYSSLFLKLIRPISKKPDYIIFLTEATKIAINSKIPSFVINNPSRYARNKNINYNNNTLITAARYCNQKDPIFALKIAKELDKLNFNYTYNLYGDGPLKDKMKKYINKYKLNNVHLISGVRDLKDAYLNSDLYLMTSKFEGYPLSAIEASSFSLPLIWVDIKDPTSSIVKDDVNGYVIKKRDPKLFANKIIEVLNNQNKLASLKESSYLDSYRYEEKVIQNEWIKVLDEVFDKIN